MTKRKLILLLSRLAFTRNRELEVGSLGTGLQDAACEARDSEQGIASVDLSYFDFDQYI